MLVSVGEKSPTDVRRIWQLVKTCALGKRKTVVPTCQESQSCNCVLHEECDEIMGGNLIGPKSRAEASLWILTAPPNPRRTFIPSFSISLCVFPVFCVCM